MQKGNMTKKIMRTSITEQKLDKEQQIQEVCYEFPYHYIPSWENETFSQVRYLFWGFYYLGGIQVVLDQLKTITFNSLIDIGCGDGRFLREVSNFYPRTKLLGIDYSESAISLARAMNPHINYEVINLIETTLPEQFDVATLVEVLEHIPPTQVDSFLKSVADSINENGKLILTVPHANKPVQSKHYQHFTSSQLLSLLEPYFQDIIFIPFGVRSLVMAILLRILGGDGRNFIITNSRLVSWFYKLYLNRYLYTDYESKCSRIAVVCRKK